jgi:hypothetical protein
VESNLIEMSTSKSYSLEESREKGNPEKILLSGTRHRRFLGVAAKLLELIS